MDPRKPHISFPPEAPSSRQGPSMHPLGLSRTARALLSVCLALAIFLTTLYRFPTSAPSHGSFTASSADEYTLRIAVAIGGTLLLWGALEVLLRFRRPTPPIATGTGSPFDGDMRALEAGWGEPFAIVRVTRGYGSAKGGPARKGSSSAAPNGQSR
ncbi:hypothetical protein C8R43DRAFT_1242193 [Mycena crocata]|nr:hypothetical protein C8R43DRAFT_1242193 [Mycena crocata]